MRATTSLHLAAALWLLTACVPKEHPNPEWLEPPESYDPVNTEGLTLNKAGVDALTLTEGEQREKHIEGLKAEGKFSGQAQCKSGSLSGDLYGKYGEYNLTCTAGAILFDIELDYHVFTTRDLGKPLSAGSYVEFEGTLVEFDYHEDAKPRQIVAKVKVDENIRKLER